MGPRPVEERDALYILLVREQVVGEGGRILAHRADRLHAVDRTCCSQVSKESGARGGDDTRPERTKIFPDSAMNERSYRLSVATRGRCGRMLSRIVAQVRAGTRCSPGARDHMLGRGVILRWVLRREAHSALLPGRASMTERGHLWRGITVAQQRQQQQQAKPASSEQDSRPRMH